MGNNSWAITIRPPYVEKIISGVKAYEIRTRLPKELDIDDEVYVVQASSGGNVVLKFRVENIMIGTPLLMWERYRRDLGVTEGEFSLYCRGKNEVYLIKLGEVERLSPPWSLEDLQLLRSPQWFIRVKACRHLPHSAAPCTVKSAISGR